MPTKRRKGPSLAASCARGRLVNERLAHARGGATRRGLLEGLARERGTTAEALDEDAKLAAAVDAVVGHCGPGAETVLLGGLLSPKDVCALSRLAPPTQRAHVEGLATTGCLPSRPLYRELALVALGRAPLPSEGLPAVETCGHVEGLSRLLRAEGLLAKDLVDLPRLDEVPSAEEAAGMREVLGRTRLVVDGLLRWLESVAAASQAGPAGGG